MSAGWGGTGILIQTLRPLPIQFPDRGALELDRLHSLSSLGVKDKSDGLRRINGRALTPKMNEDQLGMFPQRMVPNRNDANPFRTKSSQHSLQGVRSGNEFPMRNRTIVGACNRDPGAHAHLSVELLTAEHCIGADRSPVSTTDHDTFHGENSIERFGID